MSSTAVGQAPTPVQITRTPISHENIAKLQGSPQNISNQQALTVVAAHLGIAAPQVGLAGLKIEINGAVVPIDQLIPALQSYTTKPQELARIIIGLDRYVHSPSCQRRDDGTPIISGKQISTWANEAAFDGAILGEAGRIAKNKNNPQAIAERASQVSYSAPPLGHVPGGDVPVVASGETAVAPATVVYQPGKLLCGALGEEYQAAVNILFPEGASA